MRSSIIIGLSSVLFKSYLRAGSRGRARVSLVSQPRIMLLVDLIALMAPLVGLFYMLPRIPGDMLNLLEPLVAQALIGLPLLMTSAMIVVGIMFELGQSAGLSSSEAVNWLPLTPREYVTASAMSILAVYSPLPVIAVGLTLPLALRFGLEGVWLYSMLLSILALALGAFIVEILKAVMNRVSSSVYRRGGNLGIISRLVLLVLLFVVIQLAFNPYILYSFLGVIVSGVDVVWFIPMLWPSVAIIDLMRFQVPSAILFSFLSLAFMTLIFELAARLRLRYWSPTPVAMIVGTSVAYRPTTSRLSFLGFSSMETAIALKEFRALVRRKDMARFLAIPVVLIVSFFLPLLLTPGDSSFSGSSPGLFLAAYIPCIIPLMFSTIVVGQEGKAVVNLLVLPITAREFIKGKLLPAWIFSVVATLACVGIFEIIAPMGMAKFLATIVAGLFTIATEGFIGLGVGSRHPDFTAGSRSRYVTMGGFLLGLLAGAGVTLAIFAPIAITLITSGGIRGQSPLQAIGLSIMLPITVVIGSVLTYLSYRYCKKGVECFLTNFEA